MVDPLDRDGGFGGFKDCGLGPRHRADDQCQEGKSNALPPATMSGHDERLGVAPSDNNSYAVRGEVDAMGRGWGAVGEAGCCTLDSRRLRSGQALAALVSTRGVRDDAFFNFGNHFATSGIGRERRGNCG